MNNKRLMKIFSLLFVVALLAAALPLQVKAQEGPSEVWVDDDFTSETSGWGIDHFALIQDGINAVAANGTVNVAPGTYNENLVVNKSLNLIGAGDDLVTVNGVAPTTDAGMVNIVASNVTIDGFKFVAEGYKTIRLNAPTTDVTFSNNTVIGAEYTSGGGWILFESNYNNAHSNLTITGNVFENHGGQIGVYLNPQITGLTFTGNTFQGDPTSGPVLGIDGMNGTEVITGNSFAGITSPYALFEGFGDFSIVGIFNANTWPAGYIASGNRVVPASVVYPSTNDINRTNGWAHVDFVSADATARTMTFNFVQTRNFFSCVEYRTNTQTTPTYTRPNFNPEILDGMWTFKCLNAVGSTPITITLDSAATFVEFRLSFGGEKDERFYWTPFATSSCPPTDIDLSNNMIQENQPAGTTIGTFSSTDPDGDTAFTYTLVDTETEDYPDNAAFTITGNTLKSAVSFNYEVKDSYHIRVRSTDEWGAYYEEVFSILIIDVNDAPVLDPIEPKTVNELATLTFTATATDSDIPVQTLTFSLADGVGGDVPEGAGIDPSSGVFSWTPTEAQGPGRRCNSRERIATQMQG